MSASFDEMADNSADFRAISLSRNLTSEFVLIWYTQPRQKSDDPKQNL